MKLLGLAWENIFVGLLGAAIVGLVTYLTKWIKNKIMEHKFPIAGEYITKFEDEVDGQQIETTAPATLKQKGKKISGLTYLTDDNRKWIIEADLSLNGHIYGIYYAENPIDKGIGNFFLRVDNKRNMFGLWSGYDSVNGKITSGKYIFHPIHKNFNIINLAKEYIPQLLDISDEELGKDYLTYNVLEDVINNENNFICKLAYSHDEKKVIGFCLAIVVEPNDITTIIKLPENQISRALRHSEKIGVIKTVAIDKRSQGHGVGKKLTEECYNELLRRKVQSMCSVAWQGKGKINIHGILTTLGFKKIAEIANFWSDDSVDNNFSCPDCGGPPCQCSAVIYTKSVFGSNIN